MSDRRVFRWATSSARLLIGTAVSICAAIAVVTAVWLPWPTLARSPLEVTATPAPAASMIVCDGALLTIGRDPTDADAVQVAVPQSVVGGVAEGEPADEERLETVDVGEGPVAFVAQPVGDEAVDIAATGSATAAEPDLAGFAASACRPPLLDSWLVGGSATTGAADLVLLSNPGTVAATVQLTVYGVDGPQVPPGGSDLVIAPGTQRVIPLAGLALGEETPVVRVSAVGAPIHASLQASIIRTLTPGGVDQVGPVPQAETRTVITGVTVESDTGEDDGAAEATVLRMLSPSAAATARVTVNAVGRAESVREPQEVALEEGRPLAFALDGLSTGTYTVTVEADAPVVSAVWQTTGVEEGDDFAWYTPSPEVAVPSLFATPGGPTPTLSIVNPAAEAVTVGVVAADGGSTMDLTVPALGSVAVRLAPRTLYLFEPDAPVRAGLTFAGDGALAGFPIWPADVATPEIVVYP
ncbi:DUF5719 family protein [Microbacterium sp. NPDC056736]|uniref:DUF5719 family protein n=1 Tax=Microbacterium sp. NPDC056736 TaxID=3345932 RepID=UPI00366DE967